jgi:hypothetical protein
MNEHEGTDMTIDYAPRFGGGLAFGTARGLGWFSIGLGLAECLMPNAVARAVGMEGRERVVRAYGLREIATGMGLLSARDPEPWLWARVAGDALDLATIVAARREEGADRHAANIAMLAVAQVTAIDVACATALARRREGERKAQRLRASLRYEDRSGFAKPVAQMRGAASDAVIPREYRTPALLQPWRDGRPATGDSAGNA